MLPSRRRLAALAAAGLLAAPATALGQSAGDDQYQDPFAGEGQEEPSGPDTPVDDGGGSQPSEPAAAPEPAPAATGQEPAVDTGETAPAPAAESQELPRTGADAGDVLIAGSVLLAGGVALRLRLRA